MALSGDGAEPAARKLLAAPALAHAPRQPVQLFDRVFHCGPLFPRAGLGRGSGSGRRGQAPVVLSRYSQTRVLGTPTRTSMSSSPKGASTTLISSNSTERYLSLIHISEPTRQAEISYAVFCLK